jgi:GrpB-like predicted nucleotidyltransferase (UPF0157 family)/GNAT superfamily N-acetyltransferase
MKIRHATHADLEGICRVHVDAVRGLCTLHYTAPELEAWVGHLRPGAHSSDIDAKVFFVAVDEREAVLGFSVLDSSKGEVRAVYVHPTAARIGVGAALLRRVEETALERGLVRLLLDASLNSVEFYFRAGYMPVEARRHQLRSGVALRCIVMAKSLGPANGLLRTAPEMPVYLVPYDESWPTRFEEERLAISGALGERAVAVEHIGSTSIPGMMAKPIIDVLVSIARIADAPTLFDPLEGLKYHYSPYDEERTPERRWFCKPNRARRTHHLHLVEAGSRWHRDSLEFRNFLREDRGEAARYEALKLDLATRFRDDREAYTEGKTAFVRKVLERADEGA